MHLSYVNLKGKRAIRSRASQAWFASVRGVVGHNSHLELKSAENAHSFSLFSLSFSPFSTVLLRLEKVLRGLNT